MPPAAPSPKDSFVFPLNRKPYAAPNNANSNKNLITNPIYPPIVNDVKSFRHTTTYRITLRITNGITNNPIIIKQVKINLVIIFKDAMILLGVFFGVASPRLFKLSSVVSIFSELFLPEISAKIRPPNKAPTNTALKTTNKIILKFPLKIRFLLVACHGLFSCFTHLILYLEMLQWCTV